MIDNCENIKLNIYLGSFFTFLLVVLFFCAYMFAVGVRDNAQKEQSCKQKTTVMVNPNGTDLIKRYPNSVCECSYNCEFLDHENTPVKCHVQVKFYKKDFAQLKRADIDGVNVYIAKALENYYISLTKNEYSLAKIVEKIQNDVNKNENIVIEYLIIV